LYIDYPHIHVNLDGIIIYCLVQKNYENLVTEPSRLSLEVKREPGGRECEE